MKNKFIFMALFFIFGSLSASEEQEKDIPLIPNFITLLRHLYPHSALTAWLHEWESIIFSFIVGFCIFLFFYLSIKKKSLIPDRFQNFTEWILEHMNDYILQILGKRGEKYVPFLGTLFLYILLMNWFALIPLMTAPSSSLNVTIALAICVFCLVQYLNIKNYGFFGFLYHMAGSPKTLLDWIIVPLILPIEILTQLTRPFTLAMRLFGNVFGEDILIGAFALFGVLAVGSQIPIGIPLQIPFMFLAMLTGLMQALVFTLLSTIYILLSMPHKEEVR